MYTTYHIFPVLPIKDFINEDGDPVGFYVYNYTNSTQKFEKRHKLF